ncbi:SpoIIE family protein phosphatase [Pseudomonas baltica]|uniref:PP2C family protein-serine/threonine phosphatase n=1 Tax=Pseudomonas baltica TaxID=2762576 RepID=UPI00289F204A|nr:SpoIIE family protein phosphatase [Pseudomonas baltica]
MTLIASSSLTQALAQLGPRQPSALLAAVNRSVKSLLGQEQGTAQVPESDDGLDAALFWFDNVHQTLTFAGARIALHVLRPDAEAFESIPGQRMGVGYVDSDIDQQWSDICVPMPADSLMFICTDGLTDQIGGPRRIAFGRRRAMETLLPHRHAPANAMGEALQAALRQWQGEQVRRDDLTLFCARL